MRILERLMLAAATAVAAGGCAERSLPSEPGAAPGLVAPADDATTSVDASVALATVAIDDALDRVIPAFERKETADALHDAFDHVADALERGDAKLAKHVADAAELLSKVAARAPAHWGPELDALRLALGAVIAVDGGTTPR
jgi:hypothetical protein